MRASRRILTALECFCLTAMGGCSKQPPRPLNWPGFSEEVIQVSRAWKARVEEQRRVDSEKDRAWRQGEAEQREKAKEGPAPATEKAVLIEQLARLSPPAGEKEQIRARAVIDSLNERAIDPLLDIVADGTLDPKVGVAAAARLLKFAAPQPQVRFHGWPHEPDEPVELRPISQQGRKIAAAVLGFLERNSEEVLDVGSLSTLLTWDDLPRLYRLIGSTEGRCQKSYIYTFGYLTHQILPALERGSSCSPLSEEHIAEQEARIRQDQQRVVSDIRAWWGRHEGEAYNEWLAPTIQEILRTHQERLDELDRQVADGSMSAEDRAEQATPWLNSALSYRLGPTAYEPLVREFERCRPDVQPFALLLIGSTRHTDAIEFAAPFLGDSRADMQIAAMEVLKGNDPQRWLADVHRILKSTQDHRAQAKAVEFLTEQRYAAAIPDMARLLKQKDGWGSWNLCIDVIQGLGTMGGPRAEEVLREIVWKHKDARWISTALVELQRVLGSDAVVDLVKVASDDDHPLYSEAAEELEKLLESDGEPVLAEVRKNGSRELRRRIEAKDARMKREVKYRATSSDPDKLSTSVEELLRSEKSEDVSLGLRLISDNGLYEKLPAVLDLVQSTNLGLRHSAVDIALKWGIPGLNVENAPRLMGHSMELDHYIAHYCHERYGQAAIPVVRRAALQWEDPAKDSEWKFQYKSGGLIRLLCEAGDVETRKVVIRWSREMEGETRAFFVYQLAHLDDAESAALTGKLLASSDNRIRGAAVGVTRVRRLKQFADRLYKIADVPDLRAQWEELERRRTGPEKLSYEEHTKREGQLRAVQHEAFEAAATLVAIQDRRAVEAAINTLRGDELDGRKCTWCFGPEAADFGALLSTLPESDHEAMRGLLRKELAGDSVLLVVEGLTAALAYEPTQTDVDVLWEVASAVRLPFRSRALAAVALSKLGEARVTPILVELTKTSLLPSGDVCQRDGVDRGFTVYGSPPFWHVSDKVYDGRPLNNASMRTYDWPLLQTHHVSLGTALRRMGDTSLVDPLLDAVCGEKGNLNGPVYQTLVELVGARAYPMVRDEVQRRRPDLAEHLVQHVFNAQWLKFIDDSLLGVPLDEMSDLQFTSFVRAVSLPYSAELADRLRSACRACKAEWPSWDIIPSVKKLCEWGDREALDFLSDEPSQLAKLAAFLPDAPRVPDMRDRMELNYVADSIALHAWYQEHAAELKWHATSKTFRLEVRDN